MRVLVFGDSIAQGFYDEDGGWVDKIRKHFDAQAIKNHDFNTPTVFNLGVSGDFTSSVVKRFAKEADARVFPGEDFTFIFAIGTNDTLFRGSDNESEPDKYYDKLKKILELANKYTDRVMFVGLFPVVDNLLQPAPFSESGKCYSTDRMKLFNDTLESFCMDNNVKYVDLWEVFTKSAKLENLLFDGIHPNSKGHEIIADIVQPKLQELLNES